MFFHVKADFWLNKLTVIGCLLSVIRLARNR